MLRLISCLALLAATALVSSSAAANGRFPRSERLLEDPADSSHLILGGTFGLIVTNDAAATWHYVCEASFAEAGLDLDPLVALASDGALLAGIYAGVARSTDACDFQRTLGMNNRQAAPDFALSASQPGRAIGVMVQLLEGGLRRNQLYRSDDDAKTWAPLGPELPDSIRAVVTVDIAPSDANRVYLSGLGPDDAGVLLRSDDGGETFTASPIPIDASHDEVPYIAAVDPEDPDALYVRSDRWDFVADDQAMHANDALLYSNDAGAHFTELLRKPGKLYAFTFSPDTQEVLVGFGDPVEEGGGRVTEPEALGIYRAPNGSSAFEKRFAGSIGCLTWTANGLYACTLEAETGFSLGRTANVDFDLDTPAEFESLLRLQDVQGPLECPACSSGAVCRNYWETTCQAWGRSDCVALSPAPTCGAAGSPATAPDDDGPKSGCACHLAHTQGSRSSWWGLLLAAFAARRASAKALRAARALRSADSQAYPKQTATAPGAPRRLGRA